MTHNPFHRWWISTRDGEIVDGPFGTKANAEDSLRRFYGQDYIVTRGRSKENF